MKKILMMVLLLSSLNANAEVLAEMLNGAGGHIALTNVPCANGTRTWVAYSYVKSGQSLLGCWVLEGPRVFIEWSDKDLRSYPANGFVLKSNEPKKYL